jgi:prepilin-type N-terminal cleavage/methylation domain-containing protein
MRAERGFTAIELMVVISVIGVLLMIAAPSFRDFIEMQRLRGVNAELVTDIQYARSEATQRNERVGMVFGGSGSGDARIDCYTVFRHSAIGCDCSRPPGTVCANELRTVHIATSRGVQLRRATGMPASFRIDPVGGGLVGHLQEDGTTLAEYRIEVSGVRRGHLHTSINSATRLQVCTPYGSVHGVPECPS